MSRMDQIDRLIVKYEKNTKFYGPVEEGKIIQAEEQLKICFPEDYRSFLKKYGAGFLGSFEIYGIIPNLERKSIPNGIWLTEDLREKDQMPESYVAIGFDGFGNYYCIDTQKKRNEEAPIVLFQCEKDNLSEDTQSAIFISNSFSEYMLSALIEEIDFCG